MRNHFSPHRMAKACNELPREVVDAPSLAVFARGLDNALRNRQDLLVAGSIS